MGLSFARGRVRGPDYNKAEELGNGHATSCATFLFFAWVLE